MRLLRIIPFCIVTLCTAAAQSQQQGLPSSTLAELRSTDWTVRAHAYGQLKGDLQNPQRPEIKAALLNLLSQENGVIHKTLADSNGRVGVSEKYGEEYTAYYAELLDSVEKTVDWHNQREVCVLGEGSYNPDSQLATELALQGGAVVAPCLLKMAAQGSTYDRLEAVPVLVQISGTKSLPATLQRQIQQAVTATLRNAELRLGTIEALAKFGNSDVIPILQQIARTDLYSRVLLDGTRRYDVREAATKAIQSIQERTKNK